VLNEPHEAALKVGPHATRIVEPRQARKGATVRRPSRVPWEYLTGAGFVRRSQDVPFEGGCTIINYMGGPDMAPHTPPSSSRRGGAVALLYRRDSNAGA
jgi:hypothetical protein